MGGTMTVPECKASPGRGEWEIELSVEMRWINRQCISG